MSARRGATLLLVVLVLAGCAPPKIGSGDGQSGGVGQGPKSVTIGIIAEPTGIGPFNSHTSGGGAHQVEEIAHRYLATLDNRSQPYAELASALPAIETGSWTIYPDGTMDTTYRLRTGVSWHDGSPMLADDWVFGWEIDHDPLMPNASTVPVRYIDSVRAPDESTLHMHWTQTYPFANALLRRQVSPVQRARHEALYRSESDRFINSTAWSSEFVGLGPYRIAEWNQGAFIRFEAFDQYYKGRPRIDVVIVRFLQDANTLLANVLADAIDVYLPLGLEKEAARDLRGNWAAEGTGNQVLAYPDGRLRFVEVQMRPDYQRPAALNDRRIREAIYRSLDRAELMEGVIGGLGQVADSWVLPTDPARDTEFRGVIVDYSRDLQRAQRLMEEVGYRRGGDGVFASPQSGRFETAIWNTPGGGNAKENSIVADQLRTFGIPTEQYLIPASRLDDSEHRASFPGLSLTALTVTLDFENARFHYRGPTRTAPLGSPRNGYENPEVIELVDRLQVTIAADARVRLQRHIMQIAMADLPILPMYWDVETMTIRKGIVGPMARTGRHVNYPLSTWNIAEWDRQQ
jgi:peptide/nickel transport system substrate-binding protein